MRTTIVLAATATTILAAAILTQQIGETEDGRLPVRDSPRYLDADAIDRRLDRDSRSASKRVDLLRPAEPTSSPPVPVPEPERRVVDVVVAPPPLRGGFESVVAAYGALAADKLWRVADCETGYRLSAGVDPTALNWSIVGNAGELSIWQIHPIHFGDVDPARLRADLVYAAGYALRLGADGGWAVHWRICGR